MRQALLTAAIVGYVATTIAGCLPQQEYHIDDMSYADRIRLDRQPLGDAINQDLLYGTYSDGIAADGTDSLLVSEIYAANVPGARMSNLPLSNCLWLGTDAAGQAGDRLAMSWEAMLTLRQEDQVSPNPIRICRLADAEQRYVGLAVGTNSQALVGHHPVYSFNHGDGEPIRDLEVLGTILTAHPNTVPDAYGRCPIAPGLYENDAPSPAAAVQSGIEFTYSGAETHVPLDASYMCSAEDNGDGETTACAKRCAYRPPASVGDEMSLRLGFINELDFKTGELDITVIPDDVAPRWMRPNLMMVRETRTLARPMVQTAGGSTFTYRWSTPTAGAPSDPTLARWHETFGPNVLVETARFFRRESDGTEVPLDDIDGDGVTDIVDNRVVLQQMGANVICTGVVDGSTRSFPIDGCALATPTYLHDNLSDVLGNPLTEPLSWQVVFDEDPKVSSDDEIYVEFDLTVEFGAAGMQGRPLVVDLGEVPVGMRSNDWLDVINVGGMRMVIDDISIEGPDAAEFTYQLPIRPRPVPIPVDFIDQDESVAMVVGEDFPEMPLVELWTDEEQGQGLTVASAGSFEGEVVDFYGDAATMKEGLIVALDPASTFTPQLQQGTRRYAFRSAFELQSLPVELSSGDLLKVRVSALPPTYSSQPKTANLVVRGHPLTDPGQQHEIQIALRLQTKWGPDGSIAPSTVLPFYGDEVRNVLLESNGDQPLLRSWISLEGPDARHFALVSQHPTTKVLAPGEAEFFTLAFTAPAGAPCGPGAPTLDAVLRIVTDVEDHLLDLRGQPECAP